MTQLFAQLSATIRHFSMSAPGNLLLMGEYAITEDGGKGVCLAPEIRAYLVCRPTAQPFKDFQFRGIWHAGGFRWSGTPDAENCPPLLSAVFAEYAHFFTHLTLSNNHPIAQLSLPRLHTVLNNVEIELDTAAFFTKEGHKLGLGSSACSCLLLCAAVLQLATGGLEPSERDRAIHLLTPYAIAAHRRFQGGKGSGYDVLCSLSGGLSLFIGGKEPSISRLPSVLAQQLSNFCIFPGPAEIRSGTSIGVWKNWKVSNPQAAQHYIDGCAQRAQRLEELSTTGAAISPLLLRTVLSEARNEGIELGSHLGISAELPSDPLIVPPFLFTKALGAGNETGFAWGSPDELRRSFAGNPVLTISNSGLKMQPISVETVARGKLLLFGEHVALYGWPAIGIPLEEQTEIRFYKDSSASQTTLFSRLGPEWADAAPVLLARGLSVFPDLVLPPGHFEISSTVPSAGGYGSSAAASVALAQILILLAKEQDAALPDIEPNELVWRFSNWLDSYFHGSASGIDAGLADACGLTIFRARTEETAGSGSSQNEYGEAFTALNVGRESFKRPLSAAPFWIVTAAIARKGNTKSLVGAIRQRMEAQDTHAMRCVEELGLCTEKAIEEIRKGAESSVIGTLANQAHSLLSNLGLASAEQDVLLEAGNAAGADGGKLSGAGSGGAFWLICSSQQAAQNVIHALHKIALEKKIELVAAPRSFQIEA